MGTIESRSDRGKGQLHGVAGSGASGVKATESDADGRLAPISFRDRQAGIWVWHPDMEYGFPDGTVLTGRDICKERS